MNERDTMFQLKSCVALACFIVMTLLINAVGVTSADADPLYSSSDCDGITDSTWSKSLGDPIWVYFESDIGTEFSACLPSGSPISGISNTDLINVIRRAAMTWNTESRGPVLLYGGTVNAEDSGGACQQMNKPALFVRKEPGCDHGGGDCNTATGHVRFNQFGCSDSAEITFYGQLGKFSGGSLNSCSQTSNCPTGEECDCGGAIYCPDSSGTCRLPCGKDNCSNEGCRPDFRVDGEAGWRDLQSHALHEIGHALDLMHPDTQISPDPFGGVCPKGNTNPTMRCSIMQLNNSFRVSNRHLFPYDRDCVDDDGGTNWDRWERDLTPYQRVMNSSGTWTSSGQYGPSAGTAKSIGATSRWRSQSSGFWYNAFPAYFDIYAGRTYVNSDGVLSWSSYSLPSNLHNLYYAPTATSQLEYSPTWPTAQTLIYFDRPATKPGDDPPVVRWISSSNMWSTYSQYQVQHDSSPLLDTHVPIVPTWDPMSSRTIFAVVTTPRSTQDGPSGILAEHGKIRVHPGSLTPYNLRQGSYQWPLNLPADDYSTTTPNFNYVAKTDFRPGLACAPSSAGLTRNCMLAWADRGVPNGRVLYTFLKVNTSTNSIDWQPLPFPPGPNVYVAPSSVRTLDGVSLSFHAGKFWVAFKTIDLVGMSQDIGVISLSSPYGTGNWSGLQYTSMGTPVVDLPSWVSSPNTTSEAALLWTTL